MINHSIFYNGQTKSCATGFTTASFVHPVEPLEKPVQVFFWYTNPIVGERKIEELINQQAEVALLILAPILIVFLVFVNWAILLLYSKLFIAVNTMIYWAALGMFFKSTSWAIAFIFLAKGTSKLFFWSELIANTYTLILNLLGYYYLGLTGLGLSFMLGYFLYLIQVYFIAKLKFEFEFENALVKIFIFQFALALCSFLAVRFLKQPYPYVIGTALVLISTWYSFTELDKRIGVVDIIREYINSMNFNNKGRR